MKRIIDSAKSNPKLKLEWNAHDGSADEWPPSFWAIPDLTKEKERYFGCLLCLGFSIYCKIVIFAF
jgi:hypothetical protein